MTSMFKLKRYDRNPILRPTKLPWENRWVFNPGVAIYEHQIVLLYRAEGKDNISRFGLATLGADGATVVNRSRTPVFEPDPGNEYESLGIEDPRITQVNDIYYFTYTAVSAYPPLLTGPKEHRLTGMRTRVSIAHTKDFKNFTSHGVIISHIDSKDAVVFPEKFAGEYVMFHRVFPHIHLAVSGDFHSFKERGIYLSPRRDHWDAGHIGAAAPPIKTPSGWLIFYHAADSSNTYRLGVVLAKLTDPSIVLTRCDEPIFEPEMDYEKNGNVPNVVFSCGAIPWKDRILVYYGAADAVIGLAWIDKKTVYQWAAQVIAHTK